MKKLFYILTLATITIPVLSQEMVIQKNDGTNQRVELNTIESINFIIPCPGIPTVDYDGKTYNTVLIGNQCWLKENLDVGTMITGWPGNNGVIEKYCYNNLPANCETYGGLYLWDEAMQYVTTEGARGICPQGWHMPTEVEAQTLINYVESDGSALKREDQGNASGQGTNTSGFSALLSGGKQYSGGPFVALGDWGVFYLSKVGSCPGYACVYTIQVYANDNTISFGQNAMPSWGLSIRCIKDN